MTVVTAVAVLLGVLAVATVLGLVLRSRTGSARTVRGVGSTTARGIAPAEAFGARATLVQFSTPTCARCPGTRRQLDALAAQHPGVARLEIDVADRTEVAARYNVMQTPTVLLVDADHAVRTRFGGPPRPAELSAALTAVLQEAPA